MFETWIFLMGVITTSDTFLLSGMTATIKTYSEHLPWFIPDGNSSLRSMIEASSRLSINTETPTTLKEYLQELPVDHNNHTNHSSEIWVDSKVVVVARIGDYENETGGEWAMIAEPKERNETLNDNKKEGHEHITESSDYFLGNDDVQKYLKDYKDLLYTFKDFVKIGANPSLRKNISQHYIPNENKEKVFNVTYVMPIPKTKKYFEIKLSNLTKTQYNEINALLQNHILRKTNSTRTTKSKEQEIVYVDENTISNYTFVSHSLSDPSSSQNQTYKRILQKSRFTKDVPRENEPIPDYFGPLLTPEGFNYFLNNFDSIHINLNNKSVDQTIFQPGSTPPTLIQNNGFHAEIATDYGENHAKEDTSQTYNSPKDLSNSNLKNLGSSIPILNSPTGTNRTKLFPQTRSKRPIMNTPDNVLNTRYRKLSPTSVSISEQPINTVSSNQPPNHSDKNFNSNFNWINITSDPMMDEPLEITNMNASQNITTNRNSKIPNKNNTVSTNAQDLIEIYKLYNHSTKPITPLLFSDPSLNISNELFRKAADKIPQPLHVMEAAEWLIDMKRKMEEEERKKTERYKSYIKQFLGGGEGSTLLGRGNNGNIMKINKQENILEELKLLMLDYFTSLNFKTQEPISNNTSSAVQSILNATNIFELMEQSSQLVKANLNMKLQSDTQEPTKFVKRIVEKQVERCKKIFNKNSFLEAKLKFPGSTQKIGHRRFMGFAKCMNFKLQRCIKGFSLWLEKGKYFLRPQFKLERAYENYEIERNLYCLRNYTPSSLGSHPHGVRVKPGPTFSRRLGPGKIRSRQNKQRFGMRANKLKSGQHQRKSARPNTDRTKGYMQHRKYKQRPKVQRYSNKQEEHAIKLQN